MSNPDQLLSVGEAAALVGRHRTTVDEWIVSGRLPCVTLPPAHRRKGVKRYVRRSDLARVAKEFGVTIPDTAG